MRVFFLGLIVLILQTPSAFALTLAGTGDSEALLQRLATEYQRLYPEKTVEVPPSVGSSGGLRLLEQGRTDMARVARPLREEEAQQGLNWRAFALVPLVFVANLPQPCISDLSSEQLLNIFKGHFNRWSQLGDCPEKKIYLARREAGDSSNRILFEKITGLSEIKNPVGKTIYTTPETFETISAHPYTLGYLPLSQITNSSLIQFSFNGVVSNFTTIQNGTYGLQLPLALVWKGPLEGDNKDFLQFLESPEAKKLIELFGAVPISRQGI